MGRGQRENGLQLTCLESLRTGLLLPPSREPDGGNMPHEVEPAAPWAQQAAGQPGPSYTLPPCRGASPGTSKLQWLCCAEQGTTRAGVLGGREEGMRKETTHCHPPDYWLGWQGRRWKADLVYLIKSKQQFATASLPLAVCRALGAGDLACAPTKPGSCHHTPQPGIPRALHLSLVPPFPG